MLKNAIAFVRVRKVVRGLNVGLTEQERYAVAVQVIDQFVQRGDSWRLTEEAEQAPPHST